MEYLTEYAPSVVVFFVVLTHLYLDKMADTLQTKFSNAFFLNDSARILIHISLKFIPNGPVDNMSAWV